MRIFGRAPGVTWEFLQLPLTSPPTAATSEVQAVQARNYDALLVLAPSVSAATLAGNDRLVLVARFGVGYDNVDVAACTRAGVLLTITPDGVRRPVATSVLAYMLALSLRMFDKDRLTRRGGWSEKLEYMGSGLTGRTLGIIGLGNIGREIVRLARPLGMRHLAFDPYLSPADAATEGVESVDLETLLRASDIVSINCALTPETHHLIGARQLDLLRDGAIFVNCGRSWTIDQDALLRTLQTGRVWAALDVFDEEPLPLASPFRKLPNVLLTPHEAGHTVDTYQRQGDVIVDEIERFFRGDALQHQISPERFALMA